MKMLKKILAMILVISMLVGLSVSAFAKNDDNYGQNYEIDFVRVYVNGDYTPESVKVEVQRNKGTTRSVESSNVDKNWSESEGRWIMYTGNDWKFNAVRSEDITVTLNGTKVDIIDIALETIIGGKITWGLDIKVNAPQPKTYTVTFVDHDGKELKSETVNHGSAATAPDAPIRDGYTFTGWDTDFSNVTENLIVNAIYEENEVETPDPETYTVTVKYECDGDVRCLKISIPKWKPATLSLRFPPLMATKLLLVLKTAP